MIDKKKLSDVLRAGRKREYYRKGENADLSKAVEYDVEISRLLDLETLEALIKSYRLALAIEDQDLVESAEMLSASEFLQISNVIRQIQGIKEIELVDLDSFQKMALAMKEVQSVIRGSNE